MNNAIQLISIITVVYNGEEYLEDTINSVLSQSYPNIEYIIIDGGSTDNTIEIIKKYESKIAKWISEKDNGISDAFNKGIKLSTGSLVGIINADDWYEPDAIKNIVDRYKNDEIVLCGSIKLYNNQARFNVKKSTLKGIEKEMKIWHPGTFVPKSVYNKIGLYDENYKVLMDYDFVLRCRLAGIKFDFFDYNIASMRYGGISNKLISRSMYESYIIKNKYFGSKVKHALEYVFFYLYYHSIIFLKGIIYK